MKKIILIQIVMIVLLLTSCTQKSNTEISHLDINDANKQLYLNCEISDFFYCEAEVYNPPFDQSNTITLKYANFDRQDILSIFFDDMDYEIKTTVSGFVINADSMPNAYSVPECLVYTANNKVDNIVKMLDCCDHSLLTDEKSFNFMSAEEAIELGKNVINSMGTFGEAFVNEIISLDYNELNRVKSVLNSDDDYQYLKSINKVSEDIYNSGEDNLYYIKYGLSYEGMNIFFPNDDYEQIVTSLEPWLLPRKIYVEIIITSEGIQYFKMNMPLIFIAQYEKAKLITVDEALDKLKEKYDLVILTEEYVIDKIWMEYLPIIDPTDKTVDATIYLTPYWCFKIQHANEEDIPNKYKVERINAWTGGDLAYGY